jgi:hypothetical protein
MVDFKKLSRSKMVITTNEKIILPKVYEIYENTPVEYHKYAGKPKVSYSQLTSFSDMQYQIDYIRQYFYGISKPSGIWADFGKAVGEYLETSIADPKWLKKTDVDVLNKINRPSNAIYEGEIVIDFGSFVMQGFIDQEFITEDLGKLNLFDFKTGNVKTKVDFYGGKDYKQVPLYCYERTMKGYEMGETGVQLIGRLGNGNENYHNLRLSGDIVYIPIPFVLNSKRTEECLNWVIHTTKQISDLYQIFLRLKNVK